MIKKSKKSAKKIDPSQYNSYLTGSSSVFGNYCPKGEPKDTIWDKIKGKIKLVLTKVNY